MEFPDTKQYKEDPLVTNFEEYQGLTSRDVSYRFTVVFISGFVIEAVILLLIIVNLVTANKMLLLSNVFGYASLVWFGCQVGFGPAAEHQRL